MRLDGGKNGETETKAFFCFHEMPENGFWLSDQVLMSVGGHYYKIMLLHRLRQLIILLRLKRKVNRTRIHRLTDFQGL